MEDERQRQDAERQRMEQMFQWIQGLGERMGQPMPPTLFPAPPPPTSTLVSINDLSLYVPSLILSHTCKIFFFMQNQSAASNDGPQDPDL